MKIILVMSEAFLWKPKFVNDIISSLGSKNQVVGVVLSSFKPRKTSALKHITRYFIMLGPKAFIITAFKELYYSFANFIDKYITLNKFFSIEGVCRRKNIPIFKSKNVNDNNTINWISNFEPDIILSSGNQIFQSKLLSVPKIACINRHTSLLPSYKGIYPIFWCMLNGEKFVGVTIHTMTLKIDGGKILAQQKIPIKKQDTFFSLFEKCFQISVSVVIEAIKILDDGVIVKKPTNSYQESYYSYPSYNDVKLFRKKGNKML